MTAIFYWIVNMSITGSLAGIIICMLRYIKKIPRTYIHLLWCVPFLRFIIPVGFGGRFNFMSLLSKEFVRTVPITQEQDALDMSLSNYIKQADSYFPTRIENESFENMFSAFACIWFSGMILLLVFMGISYYESKRTISGATHVYKCFYKIRSSQTAAVYGIWKPRIVVSGHLSVKERKYILMHEVVHLRRADNLYRLAGLLIACVHWFNPFIWIYLRLCLEDIELSCDEKVLGKLNKEQQKEYAYTLVNHTRSVGVTNSAFGGANIRTRVSAVLNYRNITVCSSIMLSIMCILVVLLLLGNAKGRG